MFYPSAASSAHNSLKLQTVRIKLHALSLEIGSRTNLTIVRECSIQKRFKGASRTNFSYDADYSIQ